MSSSQNIDNKIEQLLQSLQNSPSSSSSPSSTSSPSTSSASTIQKPQTNTNPSTNSESSSGGIAKHIAISAVIAGIVLLAFKPIYMYELTYDQVNSIVIKKIAYVKASIIFVVLTTVVYAVQRFTNNYLL